MAAVIGASGGTLALNGVSTYRIVEMSATLTQESVDVSVLGSWMRAFIPGPRTCTISATVECDDTSALAIITSLKTSSAIASMAIVFTAAGSDTITGSCIVTSAQISTSYGDREVCALEMQVIGAVS